MNYQKFHLTKVEGQRDRETEREREFTPWNLRSEAEQIFHWGESKSALGDFLVSKSFASVLSMPKK